MDGCHVTSAKAISYAALFAQAAGVSPFVQPSGNAEDWGWGRRPAEFDWAKHWTDLREKGCLPPGWPMDPKDVTKADVIKVIDWVNSGGMTIHQSNKGKIPPLVPRGDWVRVSGGSGSDHPRQASPTPSTSSPSVRKSSRSRPSRSPMAFSSAPSSSKPALKPTKRKTRLDEVAESAASPHLMWPHTVQEKAQWLLTRAKWQEAERATSPTSISPSLPRRSSR